MRKVAGLPIAAAAAAAARRTGASVSSRGASSFALERRNDSCFLGFEERTAGWTWDLQQDSQGSAVLRSILIPVALILVVILKLRNELGPKSPGSEQFPAPSSRATATPGSSRSASLRLRANILGIARGAAFSVCSAVPPAVPRARGAAAQFSYFVVTLKAKGILKPDIHKILFGPWESICSTSRTLLFHLTRGHFALGLESFCHQLVFYVHYAENLEAAQNILKKLVKKNKAFSRFKKLQESRPELKGCRLEELLSLPLQRLHQYRHLLQDLVEHTPPESSGFDQLQGSLKSVLEVLHRVQEIARVHENLLMMRQIQKQLKGRKTQVLAPGRRYLQEGWLMEVPSKGKEMQRRRCFLFSDILLLTKPCHPLHPWNSHKFACQAVYPLSHCVVEKVFGHTQSQGGLLSLSFPQKKLLLMSCDQEDFAKWHQNLVVAIRELQVCCSLPSQKAE